jgi:hypothetical protein
MTVYVDNARIPATVGRIRARWSHLTADDREELHRFAESIGLKRAWFQECKSCKRFGKPCVHWHYDVTESKRATALASGAQPMDLRQWAELTRARRERLAAEAGEH